jgi:2'-5' RNA ligase
MTNRPRRDETAGEPRLRLFVAVELPENWLEGLGRLTEQLKAALAREPKTSTARLRLVRPEGIHCTLKFLGEVPPDRLDPIEAALSRIVIVPPAIRLEIGAPGTFGRSPRVVWVGMKGDGGALTSLAERIDAALAPLGFERERRPFSPHLTIARLPDDLSPEVRTAVARVASGLSAPDIAPFSVERISLTRSFLGPGGARYERVASFPA